MVPCIDLPSGMNYRRLASAGTTGIMQMAENGVLDAYLATLDVLNFLNYKDNPEEIKSHFSQFIAFCEAMDEEHLLWRSMADLIKARDISLFASKSLETVTDPRSKRCSTIFQGHSEKKFPNGYKRELSNFGRMATAEFKKQLEKAKGEIGAMGAGMYKLIWTVIFDKLIGKHPDHSFDDVNSKGLPFHHTNHNISANR